MSPANDKGPPPCLDIKGQNGHRLYPGYDRRLQLGLKQTSRHGSLTPKKASSNEREIDIFVISTRKAVSDRGIQKSRD
jgi:hypothetical protein